MREVWAVRYRCPHLPKARLLLRPRNHARAVGKMISPSAELSPCPGEVRWKPPVASCRCSVFRSSATAAMWSGPRRTE